MDRFDSGVQITLADKETRTIQGTLLPTGGVADRGGVQLMVAPNGVTYGDRTPVLMGHDATRPVGMVTKHEWTDNGLEVILSVAKTPAGDEALELASMGALALSAGFNPIKTTTSKDGRTITVLSGDGRECSLVSIPAMSGALISSVALADAHTTEEKGAAMTDANDAVLSALSNINANLEKLHDRPAVVPTAVAHVNEAPLYKLDGEGGQHNFAEDLGRAYKGDSAARERLDAFVAEKFAVSSGDVSPQLAPQWNANLYVGPRPYQRVLDSVITRGTLTNIQPFAFPKFVGTSGTLVAPHVEGVEPTLAGASWTNQTVNPAALSGKAEFTRETIDLAGPAAQALMWNEMVKASERAAELRLRTLLDGLTLPAGQVKAVNGTGSALADALDTMLLALNEPSRFDGAIAAPALFSDLYTAKDTTGRRLFSAIAPSNANGTATGRRSIDANGLVFIQGKDSDGTGTTNSYLVDSGTVHQFLSAPRRLDFDIQVKSIYMGFWQYSAEAVTDATGVVRVTHASS